MREDYSEKFKFDGVDEDAGTASRLALWIWPVLGVFAIAIIIITALQSPWLLEKAGFPVKASKTTASSAPPAGFSEQQKPPATQQTAELKKIKTVAAADIANLKIEMSQMADTLKAINASLNTQTARIARLEGIVGAVTGSIPAPESKNASSSQPKTGRVKPESQVNSAAKADLLTSVPVARKNISSALTPASPATSHQDTGEARAKPEATKTAALNTTNIARPAKTPVKNRARPVKTKAQYAVKLARARTVSRLAVEWERLIRGKAGELSVLEPQVMPATTKAGEKVFDLVAGPFNHMADAIELCARLKLEGIKCKQSRYGGKPL